MEFDSPIDLLQDRLFASILNHALADVNANQRHLWIRLSSLNCPAPRSTSNIKHALKTRDIGLLRQNSSHQSSDHTILNCQASKLKLVLPVLDKIGTGLLFFWRLR